MNTEGKYQSYCNNVLNIKIYCKPVAHDRIKIVVNTKGKEKIGEKIYKNNPGLKDDKYWEIIQSLYKQYYQLNYKPPVEELFVHYELVSEYNDINFK